MSKAFYQFFTNGIRYAYKKEDLPTSGGIYKRHSIFYSGFSSLDFNDPSFVVFALGILVTVFVHGILVWRNQFLLRSEFEAIKQLIDQKLSNERDHNNIEMKRIEEKVTRMDEGVSKLENFIVLGIKKNFYNDRDR